MNDVTPIVNDVSEPLTAAEKHAISHRGRALRAIAPQLAGLP